MGQRLGINIIKDDKILASAYYHWGAYTSEAFAYCMEIIEHFLESKQNNAINNFSSPKDFALYLLEKTEAGEENISLDDEMSSMADMEINIDLTKQTTQILLYETATWSDGKIIFDDKEIEEYFKENYPTGEFWVCDMQSISDTNPALEVKFGDFEQIFWSLFNKEYQQAQEPCFFKFGDIYYQSLEMEDDEKTPPNYRLIHKSKLCNAIFKHKEEKALKLIQDGANVNIVAKKGYPLHYAAGTGQIRIAKALIKAGAEIDSRSATLRTPLFEAVLMGYIDIAKLLLESGADINAKDMYGNNVLCVAIYNDESSVQEKKQILKYLLDCGANLESILPTLIILIDEGRQSLEILEFFLQYGIDINGDGAKSLLDCAIDLGNKEIFNLLKSYGAKARYFDESDIDLPKDELCEYIDEENKSATIKLTQQEHNNILNNFYGGSKNGELLLALMQNDTKQVQELIKQGADVNEVDLMNQSSLSYAVHMQNTEITKILLNAGANPNVYDAVGNTMLITAVAQENLALVELLLQAGADINLKSKSGIGVQEISANLKIQALIKKYS